MPSLNYREWDIFTHDQAKASQKIFHGHYICYVPPFTMAVQTIGLLNESFELHTSGPIRLFDQFNRGTPPTEPLVPIKVFGQYEPSKDAREQIDAISDYLNALAICIDFPLLLLQIQFVDLQQGLVMHASRKSFGRGVGLEVEERATISDKICSDFDRFRNHLESDSSSEKVAIRHYLTGMTLLSLEDQAPGLVDAAYMQFYQGVEAVLGTHDLKEAKKLIAKHQDTNSRTSQIMCHQTFAVRHKYFGHADEHSFHEISDAGLLEAFQIAKQCLVARWLCRMLIDQIGITKEPLRREMRLYGAGGSDAFFGTLEELESNFWVDFGQTTEAKKRDCDIYDPAGSVNETYNFQLSPI